MCLMGFPNPVTPITPRGGVLRARQYLSASVAAHYARCCTGARDAGSHRALGLDVRQRSAGAGVGLELVVVQPRRHEEILPPIAAPRPRSARVRLALDSTVPFLT